MNSKSIARVMFSNGLKAIIMLGTVFLIPKLIPIEEYGIYKTFMFYAGFTGFLHFGYIDGLYIKYGGRETLDADIIYLERQHLIKTQLILFLFAMIIYLITKNEMVLFLLGYSFLTNVITMYSYLYQATFDFKNYSKILLVVPSFILIISLVNIYIFKNYTGNALIIVTLGVSLVTFLFLEIKNYINFYKKSNRINSKINHIEIYKQGFPLLLANLVFLLFSSLDRFFINYRFDLQAFSIYSFALSVFSIVNIVMSSLSVTFYPFLARNSEENYVNKAKNKIYIIGIILMFIYFPIKMIVLLFLPKYSEAINVLFYLFMSLPALFLNRIIITNLYKVRGLQKKYLKLSIITLLISFILNLIVILLVPSLENLALMTMLSTYLWNYLSNKDFPVLRFSKQQILIITICLSVYTFLNKL